MANTMHVEVVSAEQHVLSAEATELYARSVEGEIGILPGHQPAVVALDSGPVKVRFENGGEELIAVHHGVLYVEHGGKVIVLADIAELGSKIDVRRAEKRRDALRAHLANRDDDVVLQASLRKQELRLSVASNS